jgi:hypothetical protein
VGGRGESLTSAPNRTSDCPNHCLVIILTVLSWLPPELGFQVLPVKCSSASDIFLVEGRGTKLCCVVLQNWVSRGTSMWCKLCLGNSMELA